MENKSRHLKICESLLPLFSDLQDLYESECLHLGEAITELEKLVALFNGNVLISGRYESVLATLRELEKAANLRCADCWSTKDVVLDELKKFQLEHDGLPF